MNTWPVTLSGVLGPARGKLNQYEFWCHNHDQIKKLPLPPYVVTVSQGKGHNKGIPIICQFNSHTVKGQFHRKTENKDIWIGSNFTDMYDRNETQNWHTFVSLFAIRVGTDDKQVPVHLDFYPDPRVIIR